MKSLPRFLQFLTAAALGTTTLLHAQLGPSPDAFFKPAPTAPENLPADKVYPVGRQFPFSFFSLGGGVGADQHAALPEEEVRQQFERYKKVGLKLFGPQYEMNGRALEDARAHGLQVIYTVTYGEPRFFHQKPAVPLDEKDVTRSITEQVKAVADNESIAIWYLQPEELRPWRKDEMTFLEVASKAIREADPRKRPIWIYDPAHASAGRLKSIAPWVDYLGKGMYTNYASMQENRIWVRWSMEQEVEAIRLADAKAVPLAVPEMYHDSRRPPLTDEAIAKIPAWVRHDTYLSVATGAKGVVIFSLRQRPSLPPKAWEAYYEAYTRAARELLGPFGQAVLFGEKRGDIVIDHVSGPQELELVFPSGGLKEPVRYPSVTSLDLAYGNERYLLLVNSANEPVEVAVGGLPYASAQARELFDDDKPAFAVGEGEFPVELAPLEVRAYHFTRQ
ncbi:MAG TPA: hypothetical protein VNQ90_03920 [Chthoniobacteraceae bacterium]|nr:hypothetical protein [Chthoniobacteraceae bacterium]